MKFIKLKIVGGYKNKILPVMPDGETIPNIVKGSMEIITDPMLSEVGYFKLKLEVYVKNENLDIVLLNPELFNGPVK